MTREKPYLYVDARGAYQVFVPAAAHDSRRHVVGRRARRRAARSRSRDFFVAKPGDSAQTINKRARPRAEPAAHPRRLRPRPDDQGQARRHRRARPRLRRRLTPTTGQVAMTRRRRARRRHRRAHLRRRPGQLAGAAAGRHAQGRHAATSATAADPTALQDVFFRIGGAHAGKATRQPRGQQRPRHPRRHLGLAGRPRQRRRLDAATPPTPAWSSTATTSPPTACSSSTTRSTEVHLERRATARSIFFQNEMPYDPPSQAAWMSAPGHRRLRRRCRSPTRCSSFTRLRDGLATASSTRASTSSPTTPSRCRRRSGGQPARPADDLPRPDQRQGRHPQRRQRHRRLVDGRQPGRPGHGRRLPLSSLLPARRSYAVGPGGVVLCSTVG